MRCMLLAAAAAISLAAPAGATTVVTADRMLDVTTGRYVEHPAIFIDDNGRITSVADARSVRFTDQVQHIDLPGETLLPGLIDMHVHLTSLAEDRRLSGPQVHRQFLDRGRRRQWREDAQRGLHHGAQRRLVQLRRRRA